MSIVIRRDIIRYTTRALELGFQHSFTLGTQVIQLLVVWVLCFQQVLHQLVKLGNLPLYLASLYLGIQLLVHTLGTLVNDKLISGDVSYRYPSPIHSREVFLCNTATDTVCRHHCTGIVCHYCLLCVPHRHCCWLLAGYEC